MAIRFGLYYFSESVGNYLQKVVNDSASGLVAKAWLITDSLPIPEEGEADAWFIEYDETSADMEGWLKKINDKLEQPFIILYLREATVETLIQAMRLGVQDCFVGEVSATAFAETLQRIFKAKKNLHQEMPTRIVSLVGSKGGSGVTFLAVNLAQALVDLKQPTLLVDLDFSPDGITGVLDIQPRYTIMDVIDNFTRLDPQYLKDILHSLAIGLQILPGPPSLEDYYLIQPQQVDKILQYIRVQQLFNWLILDLGDTLNELTLKALEKSDQILLVILLTVPGLKAAKKILEMWETFNLDGSRLRLVANAYQKKNSVSPEEGEKYLGQDFAAILPFEPAAVLRSLNEGIPLVAKHPQHKLAAQIISLARKLKEPEAEKPPRRGWLSSLFHRQR